MRGGVIAYAGRQRGLDVGDRQVVPSSTSEALASALSVLVAASSVALPVPAPETTGASLVPVTVMVRLAELEPPWLSELV